MRSCGRFLSLAVLIVVSACGNSATSTTTTIPQANPLVRSPPTTTQSVRLGLEPTNAVLPVVSEITGTLLFPAVRTPATVTLSASATPPAGVATASLQRTQSGTLTVYEYVTIISPITVTLPSIPAITLHFPVSTPLTGKSFFYGISDLNAQGGLVSFNTQGPGTLDGQTVSFAQIPTSLTFAAGHTYTFVVYATASASVKAGATKIYVTNQGSGPNFIGTLTTYNADGTRTTPTITAGLSGPAGVAVDAAGKIYVANSSNNSVTTYKADGAQTTPTITAGINNPLGVAVDAAGKIYVINAGNSTVTTYTADGKRTTPTIAVTSAQYFPPQGVAVDATGKIHVLVSGFGVQTFDATGSASTPTITERLLSPSGIAVDTSGRIYVTNLGTMANGHWYNSNVTIFNPDGSQSTAPVITAGIDLPSAAAVDTGGKIYVANVTQNGANTGTVTTYNADGSPTTPTISAGLDTPDGIAVH